MPATITRQAPSDTLRSFGVTHYRKAYDAGINVSQLLERMDPTSERPAAERGLDAFDRLMKEAGLVVNPIEDQGIRASTWEEACSQPNTRALLPEYLSRVWRRSTRLTSAQQVALAGADGADAYSRDMLLQGARAILLSGDAALGGIANPWYDAQDIRYKRLVPLIPLDRIVARTSAIDTDAYRAMYIVDDFGTDAYRMKRVAQGAEIPRTTLVTGEHTIRLFKYGRALQATYEQLRRQRMDRIAFIIARMAVQAEVDKVSMVINTIINGDGNANTSVVTVNQSTLDTAGSLTLKAWELFHLQFALTYAPDVVLANQAQIGALLMLPVAVGVNNTQIPFGMMQQGPFGSVVPISPQLGGRMAYGVTADTPTNTLLAFNSGLTVERVTEVGGNVSEVERFVNNQTQLLTMTEVEGYDILDPNAAKLLNVAA